MANSFVFLTDLNLASVLSPLRCDFSAERIQCRYQQKILDIIDRFFESGDKDHLWHSRLLALVERIQRDDGVDGGIFKETISGAVGEKMILI
ncbi:hypothetical protein IGI04_035619 [Brassica rapa subsp. trilocularis]|uniref:Uncharacterized protein n=1 Tax=Brassica rapa subsp. trilocularis TaxID=1813537 RepID=A0ABQ7LF20_BRACM|nr:hypothetical protein IGI04_035619 [Brassica rapa subsp. trilocularis]